MGARAGRGRVEAGSAERRRPHRMMRAAVLLAVAAVVLGLIGCEPPGGPAGATSVSHPTLVRDTPTATTPHVTDGNVRSVAVVGSTVVLGGDFTGAANPDRTPVARSYLLAFDRTTGRIRTDWAPQLDNEVFSVVAAPDGQSVYVGGRFNRVNGASQLKIARISMTDGSRMPFQSGFDAVVTTMALQRDRLFVGGVFNNVQGRQRRVVALNPQTGVVDDTMDVAFSGKHNGGDGKIWRIEPAPDGQSLMVVGSFTSVGGQSRNQIVKLATAGSGPVTVSPWSTTAFAGRCASFTDYVRDVSYSPDSSYFVVATTGAKGTGLDGTCDSVSRWANTDQAGSAHTWIQYSGGDSYYSVEVTGAAIYVGGHFRWSNNSYGTDSLGPGGVATTGIASLDPANGMPLSWNPGRDRGRAVWQLVATPDGLWVASDTDRIAGGLYRGRIAFFPLAGGRPVPQPTRLTLPVTLEQYVPGSGGSASRIAARGFDGTTVAAPQTTVANASALANATAATYVDGILYTAHTNGTLRARSFDGAALGPATDVDLQRMTSFASDLANMRAMAYDGGRLYYTVGGSSALYMRYLSTESRVVGAQRFQVASSSGAISYGNITGMVVVGDDVYFVDTSTGQLRRSAWRGQAGGINPSGVQVVSAANAGGLSWSSTELWARSGQAPNQPPTAAFTASCTGLRCTFDASGSSDADGSITGVQWAFSDGGTATGVTATRTFAAPGTYTATLTVTDDRGASAIATQPVNPFDVAPVARFTSSCVDATCTVDGSTSSDVDGTVTAYAWTFGDGATATGVTASHTYAQSGTYAVGLTVTDDRGRTHTRTQDVAVTVPAVPASFVAAASTVGPTATTHRVTVPGEVEAGDQLLLFASTNGTSATTVATPAGWTRVLDPVTSGSRHAVFARTATAADAGSSVAVTLSAVAKADVVVAAYRGLVLAPSGGEFATGYTTPTLAATAGDWVVSYWADKSATTAEWAAPAGVSVRHQFAGTGAGHVAELLADTGGPVAGGPVGGQQATVAAPVANAVGITVLLSPAP